MSRTHTLEPTLATLHGHFSRELPPVLTIDSGDRVRFRTLAVHWGRFDSPDPFQRTPEIEGRDRERDPGHALVGPVAIRGARAGQTLEVRILTVRPGGYGFVVGGGSGREWNQKVGIADEPGIANHFRLDPDANTATDSSGLVLPLRPFPGVIGMPPDLPGRHPTTPPRACGGNIDCRELVAGSTLWLPVPVDGAL
ncbi:MAG TPA: acetamidase/formamidase family protein, partial [Dongiaceae bacterium]|nr:acetamidase/formamidase family protein [Dongiaceae bacterium]